MFRPSFWLVTSSLALAMILTACGGGAAPAPQQTTGEAAEAPAGSESGPADSRSTSGQNPITAANAAAIVEQTPLQGDLIWAGPVSVSPDGALLLVSDEVENVYLVRVSTGEILQHFPGIEAIAFSPDGSTFVTAGFTFIDVWDTVSGELMLRLEGHNNHVYDAEFSLNTGQLVSGSGGRTRDEFSLRLWDTSTGEQIWLIPQEESVRSVAITADGSRVALGLIGGRVELWDVQTETSLAAVEAHDGTVIGLEFSPDGARLISAGSDGLVKVWDGMTGEALMTLEGHSEEVTSLAISPDGSLIVSGGQDALINLWDSASGNLLRTFTIAPLVEGAQDRVNSVAFARDGSLLAAGVADGTVRLWRAPD